MAQFQFYTARSYMNGTPYCVSNSCKFSLYFFAYRIKLLQSESSFPRGRIPAKIKSILPICPRGHFASNHYTCATITPTTTLALPHLSGSFILVQRHKRPSSFSASADAFRCTMTSFTVRRGKKKKGCGFRSGHRLKEFG